jgi:membrane protein
VVYAVGFLLLTIMYALETTLVPWLAALIVAVGVMMIAMVAVSIGRKRMKQVHLPEKTIETMKENVQWAKQQIR